MRRLLACCLLACIPAATLLLCDIPASFPYAWDEADATIRAFLAPPAHPVAADPDEPAERLTLPWGELVPLPAWPDSQEPPLARDDPDSAARDFLALRVESIMSGRIPIAKINGRLYRPGNEIALDIKIAAITDRGVEFVVADSVLICGSDGSVAVITDGEMAERIMRLDAQRKAAAAPPADPD